MMFESALADVCSLGLRGDRQSWKTTILAIRQSVDQGTRSPQWAGHLGMLLLLAGRGDRAVQVFDMLAEMLKSSSPRTNGHGVRLGWEGGVWHWPADRLGRPIESDGDTRALAALVLSGRWAQARRCCRELVEQDRFWARGK
ncbi:MAG: hypothetical protein ACE5GE_17375 [Phycisphaerae bacterium]